MKNKNIMDDEHLKIVTSTKEAAALFMKLVDDFKEGGMTLEEFLSYYPFHLEWNKNYIFSDATKRDRTLMPTFQTLVGKKRADIINNCIRKVDEQEDEKKAKKS